MAIPDYQTLMLPVLRHAAEGECRVMDLVTRIADEFALSEDEREQLLPSGKQKILHNRIHWAKFHMQKAGLVRSPSRGVFVATEDGKKLLLSRPARIDVSLLAKLSPAFRDFIKTVRNSEQGEESVAASEAHGSRTALTASVTPEEEIEKANSVLHAALASDLLQRILQNSSSFFEQLIIELLVKMGYGGNRADAAKQLGKSGDGGVDGIISEDRLGLDRIYIQAKCYALNRSIGRPDVQAFLGSLVGHGATKGVFVTTCAYSSHAKDFVRHLPQRIVLIDGDALAELMIEHGVGVRTNRVIELKKRDEDFFSGDE